MRLELAGKLTKRLSKNTGVKMNLVVDANSVISALIKDEKSAELLLSFSLNFHTPEYIFEEIEEHKNEILEKTHRTESEFNNLLNDLRNIVNVILKEDFEEYIAEAEKISPDPDDVMYFALALKLNCEIWSNDKKFKNQNIIGIFTTKELVEIVENKFLSLQT